jgi:hypothetical protein
VLVELHCHNRRPNGRPRPLATAHPASPREAADAISSRASPGGAIGLLALALASPCSARTRVRNTLTIVQKQNRINNKLELDALPLKQLKAHLWCCTLEVNNPQPHAFDKFLSPTSARELKSTHGY